MNNKRLLVVGLLFVFVLNVIGEMGGVCEGNVLKWYDHMGVFRTRDCSVLRTGAGIQYRGECRLYGTNAGAACYKIEGEVTHEYIINSRKESDAIINPSTTTTTIQPPIVNVKCPEVKCEPCIQNCDNSEYLVAIRYLNNTLVECKDDLKGLEADYLSRVPMAEFRRVSMEFDEKAAVLRNVTEAIADELEYERSWSAFYKYSTLFAFGMILFLVYVWVKKPQLEDSDVDLKL